MGWLINKDAMTPLFLSPLQEQRDKLTVRIQNAGTEVVDAKAGAVSSPIMAVNI